MEEIKAPKKERKFLKAVGNIAKVLANELIMGIGRKFIGKAINKVGNKRQGLVIAFLLVAGISYASIDSIPYPITGNKQRLGFQTTGNGLVWRGLATDTITKPTSYADKNVKAYLVLDSVTGSIYVWKQGVWASLVGGGSFTQPVDSLFFDTSVSPNNVDTAKMRWDSELGTVVLGMYDQVPNELGFKNFWLVKNQTGSTIAKNSLVYASGTVGASGRILVSKFIANGSIDAKLLLGITAHDLTNGEDGYVISFGKIRQVNTDTFADGAILYPSPTTAGVWTDIEPVAPNIDMPIGFCINSSSNNGTISIRVASGYSLNELHNVAISSPVEKSSLYYSGGLWRDTTAALLVSDTSAMLANYATKAYADTSGRFYARQDFRNVSSSTLTWTQTDTLVVNDTTSLPRVGGGGGSGSGSLTSVSAGTGITVSPNPITTTGTVSADLSVLMELTDTTLLNLTTRFATKQNNITLTTTGSSGASTLSGDTLNIPQYTGGSGTVTSVSSGYGLLGGPITTTGTLTVDTSTVYDFVRDSIVAVEIGGDTIKIIKQEYENVTSDTLVFTILPKFPIQLRQFILLFRNGQLLLNDQFSVIDTNKVKVAATSFKLGENYTLVTVSGIGSVSSGQGNPIYPEAGIALSTGTTWTTSITNNSSNWNTAFTDRLKWDGGSTGLVAATGRTSLGGTTIGQSMFTLTNPSAITFPQFNADNSVSALSAASFRSAIGGGTVTSVTVSGTAGNPLSITNTTTTPVIELLSATSARNGYLTSTDWTTFNNKQPQLSGTGFVKASGTSISYDNSTYLTSSTGVTTFSAASTGLTPSTATSGAITLGGTLALTNGGTGATSPSGARTALGATVRGANTFLLTDIGAISFLRYNADNTVSQRAADGMRSDLGGTTIGQSMFTLTNPSAVTFPRFNADNTVSALSAADFRTAIGAGTGNGNGTVTSVTGSLPISSSGGTTPNITIANAGVSTTGVVTASTQTFGGTKTFAGDINGSSALNITGFSTLTGGASVGTMTTTSSLTHIIGVNSSNAIGEIALGSGLNLSSGTLNLGGFVLATLDFPNTSAQSSSDITVSYTGAAVSHPVMLAIPDGSAPANTNYTAWVSSANTVKIRFNNYSSGSINPASGQFTVFVLNL